jgi:hypothetical protein
MAKRLSLDIDFSEGYQLLGIVTQMKDYRLAYFINKQMMVHLKKYKDLQLSEKGGTYSWYCFTKKEHNQSLFLFSNHHEKGKLVTSQKMDFFLLVKNIYDKNEIGEMTSKIRKIPDVLAVFILDVKKIRNMDLIIEAIEMHELEEVIKPSKQMRPDL